MQLLDLVMPPACAACRAVGSILCAPCRSAIRPASDHADRFVVPDAGVVLGDRLILGVAAMAHTGPMRSALAALKYRGMRRLAPVLASLAVPTLSRVVATSGRATLVPVPVHAERRAERGYNQAELLARELGRHSELAVLDALQRTHPTTKQHRLDRVARLANLRGAFAARGPVPSVAILVDDIITTSATLEACAGALAEAGCEAVYAVAVAREV
jgi:ComF family protein